MCDVAPPVGDRFLLLTLMTRDAGDVVDVGSGWAIPIVAQRTPTP